ncbi:CPBP family intramembrane metalloprotease [Rubrobacter tropicus]|uniref:CPBP family intramembrane metalloprotease n=1 Tax=Rubrobacter tropicus TaxID=2653851 RepID=A0A6G8Q5L1_9ACTN|nr:CPBP family intramembrane glutamic endopeptidase [Rubrobacter tropicus]QIN81765.1 CPBP family intramembrane metalloprotease [Rubrobacter tropicus]
MLSVVMTNTAVAALVICVFWLGVTVARALGRKASFSLAPLGFSRPKGGVLAGIGTGIAVGVGAIVMSVIVNPISAYLLDSLGYSTESTVQQPFMRGLVGWVESNPSLAIPAILLVVVLFGPAVEELVFRGAIFNGLNRLGALVFSRTTVSGNPANRTNRTAFVLSALVSSVFFALLHLEPVLLPAIFILAIALCALFQRTGSLLPPLIAHATFNSFATSLIILNGLGVFELPV